MAYGDDKDHHFCMSLCMCYQTNYRGYVELMNSGWTTIALILCFAMNCGTIHNTRLLWGPDNHLMGLAAGSLVLSLVTAVGNYGAVRYGPRSPVWPLSILSALFYSANIIISSFMLKFYYHDRGCRELVGLAEGEDLTSYDKRQCAVVPGSGISGIVGGFIGFLVMAIHFYGICKLEKKEVKNNPDRFQIRMEPSPQPYPEAETNPNV